MLSVVKRFLALIPHWHGICYSVHEQPRGGPAEAGEDESAGYSGDPQRRRRTEPTCCGSVPVILQPLEAACKQVLPSKLTSC